LGTVKNSVIEIKDLSQFDTHGGTVKQIIKTNNEPEFSLGEAYFTSISYGVVRGWKLHTRMTMNLVVPVGDVKFVFYSEKTKTFQKEVLGQSRYVRATVPPNIWFAFEGLNPCGNLILNLASISFDPSEVLRLDLSEIEFNWGN